MISLRKAEKRYGEGDNLIRACAGVSLEVGRGEFVVITGPSGSGKTTLLNLVGGMTFPDAGEVIVGAKNLGSLPDKEMSLFRARTMGFVFQFQSMLPTLTALENVALPLVFAGRGEEKNRAVELLGSVGLAERAEAYSHELSAGQEQRVCIARALANQPALLLCDEPTGDLDPATESVIMGLLAGSHSDGATVLMTTHNYSLRDWGSRSLRMEAGEVFED